MITFMRDMITMTEGEKLIKYWWLWLPIILIVFVIMRIIAKRGD